MKKINPLIVVSIVLIFLLVQLLFNYSHRFEDINKCYLDNVSINLSHNTSSEDISHIIECNNYVANKEDADFISDFLIGRLKSGQTLTSLSDLNKRVWQIPSSLIDSIGSEGYVSKLNKSKERIGIDEEYYDIDTMLLNHEIKLSPKSSSMISVTVTEKIDSAGFLDKLLRRDDRKCEGVIVRLSIQGIDSLNNSERKTLAYLKTDQNGQVAFKGLDPEMSYSVLPIRNGYEYGPSKGTVGGNLSESIKNQSGFIDKLLGKHSDSLVCEFVQQEHRIRVFEPYILKQIREDKTLTIRSPKEYKTILIRCFLLFFVSWWALYLFELRKKGRIDKGFLAILMALTGISLLTMFSVNDPMMDKLLGIDLAVGVVAGVILIAVLQSVDIKKLYQNKCYIGFDIPLEITKWVFKPFRAKVLYLTKVLSSRSSSIFTKVLALVGIVICLPTLILDIIQVTRLNATVSKKFDFLPKGSGYLFAAILLTMLLFTPLGVSVGGMRVNLKIGVLFQPSEIVKYLIVIFMAAFFCTRTNSIIQFSAKGNVQLWKSKFKTLILVLIGLVVLFGLYLMLGDMGPALVLAFTFIVLYSIIKSKVEIEGLSTDVQLKHIMSCDIAMLMYGIITFVLCLYLGNYWGNLAMFCCLWFVGWIVMGLIKKQVFETPIFFNLIIAAFIFGGDIAKNIPGLDSVTERLDSRNEMCVNTWGTLPIEGGRDDSGENTQVVEGLWGLASGGFSGQGLGNGSSYYIPAYHTDMILESIGEQSGFLGILTIIILMALLLRKTIIIGYKSYHSFTFYLCIGIAVVTGIQFLIISLGSLGIIPLTGVTVPFLSYGKVSMILNLVAFGIIMSIHTNGINSTEIETVAFSFSKQNIAKYNYPISLLCWIYNLLSVAICGIFFYYSVLVREKTLIRPVYVNNNSGIPVIEYNPRINQITQKMYSGDIYDRNGILLATSDKTRFSDSLQTQYRNVLGEDFKFDMKSRQDRYYPFGEHLAFILGDRNSDLFVFNNERAGYMAEVRHYSELHGYNRRKDNNGKELPRVDLSSHSYQIDRWHPADRSFKVTVPLYNYSKLLPYLKSGLYSRKVQNFNNDRNNNGEIVPNDIHLTIDAKLQTEIQRRLCKEFYDSDLMRVSVVILDAQHGDLLTSANYPLPNPKRLYSELKDGKLPVYNDAGHSKDWTSYSDMDLGLVFPTPPGSTAKVMSALAGLKGMGVEAANPHNKDYSYRVLQEHRVGADPVGEINMSRAIVESSNCYFINLINEYDLYDELKYIYSNVGVSIGSEMPYGLFYSDSTNLNNFHDRIIDTNPHEAVMKYQAFVKDGRKGKMNKHQAWQWTWGQGNMDATPLSMARVASIVANNGVLSATRYTLQDKIKEIKIVNYLEAEALCKLMCKEATEHTIYKFSLNDNVGGKTGTAHRNLGLKRSMDAWYICYVKPKSDNKIPISIAVRIERGQTSVLAKKITRDIIMDTLKEFQYVD